MTDDERAATRTTRCRFCGAPPRRGCLTRPGYAGTHEGHQPRRRPHKQRMTDWRNGKAGS